MSNQNHNANNDTTIDINDGDVHSACNRQFGIAGTALAISAIVLAACGGTSNTRAIDPAPGTPGVAPSLSDPGPAHQPDHGLLAAILRPQIAGPVVEFGGMPAPAGEPNWLAVSVQPPAVEFGGLPAPTGPPNWSARAIVGSPVEFGVLPAPAGEPNWGALSTTPIAVEVDSGPR